LTSPYEGEKEQAMATLVAKDLKRLPLFAALDDPDRDFLAKNLSREFAPA